MSLVVFPRSLCSFFVLKKTQGTIRTLMTLDFGMFTFILNSNYKVKRFFSGHKSHVTCHALSRREGPAGSKGGSSLAALKGQGREKSRGLPVSSPFSAHTPPLSSGGLRGLRLREGAKWELRVSGDPARRRPRVSSLADPFDRRDRYLALLAVGLLESFDFLLDLLRRVGIERSPLDGARDLDVLDDRVCAIVPPRLLGRPDERRPGLEVALVPLLELDVLVEDRDLARRDLPHLRRPGRLAEGGGVAHPADLGAGGGGLR